MIVLILGVPMALMALRPLVRRIVTPTFGEPRGAFHFKDGVWTPGPPIPGGLWGLQVSSQGALWTISVSPPGLCRLDGDRWTHYGGKQFGSRTDWLRGGFALRDEELWGATGEGIVRFDGQSWRLYTDALRTNRPADTVAGRSGVWIVDHDGNLSHFDGSGWTVRSLNGVVPATPPAGRYSRDRLPRLAMTGDGRLWVSWRGLWCQDGETWSEVRSPGLNLAEVWPIGHDAENVWLWLWPTGEVAAVAPDGRVAARYSAREMGLTERVRIDWLATANGRIWVASSAGLLTFDGGRWTNRGLPPGCTMVTDVALAPDGSAWVAAETRSFAADARSYAPLAFCLIPAVVLCLLLSAWLHGRAENILATEQVLVTAAGDLPGIDLATGQADIDRQARWLKWKLCAGLVGFPSVAIAVEMAAWRVWPSAPAWAPHTGVPGFVVLACLVWLWISQRRRSATGNAEQTQRSRVRVAMWQPAKWMLLLAILSFGCLVPFSWVSWLIPNASWAKHVRALLVTLPVVLIFFGRDIAAALLIRPALYAGDYEHAMRWVRRLSFGRPSALLIEVEGRIHALANRPAEAEACLRQALAKSYTNVFSSPSGRADLLDCLGNALKLRAVMRKPGSACKAVSIWGTTTRHPRGSIWRSCCWSGRANRSIDEAMHTAKGRVAKKVEPRHWASRAWALALLGRREEAEQAIERATRVRRETHVALFASTRLNVGMALLAMHQPEKAIGHFRAAHEADRDGKYGVLALQQLEQHGVWDQ